MDHLFIHSNPDLTLEIKNKLSNILHRHGKQEFCPMCCDIIDLIGPDLVENSVEEIYKEIDDLRSDIPFDTVTVREAEQIAEREFRYRSENIIKHIKELKDELKKLTDFLDSPKPINIREPEAKTKNTLTINLRKILEKSESA